MRFLEYFFSTLTNEEKEYLWQVQNRRNTVKSAKKQRLAARYVRQRKNTLTKTS